MISLRPDDHVPQVDGIFASGDKRRGASDEGGVEQAVDALPDGPVRELGLIRPPLRCSGHERPVYARARHCTALSGRAGYVPTVREMIKRDGPVAPWRQIGEIYRRRIESGELKSGDRLPSIRSISQEFEVATTTAQKVIEALRDEGLAETSPMGTFVK